MENRALRESFNEATSNSTSPNWVENCGLMSFRGNCFPGERSSSAVSELGRRTAEMAADGISRACQRDVRQELELLAAKLACGGFFLKSGELAKSLISRTLEVSASGVSDKIPSGKPYQPVLILDGNKHGRDIALTNGDHFRVSAAGQIHWTDSRGLPIKQVRRIDNDMIPGNSTYEMSNGARYNSGCFADSITYPNGDTISFSRGGRVTSAVVRGRKLI